MTTEEVVFQLILHGGNARGLCLEAISFAKKGEIEKAKTKIEEADKEITKAHQIQTQLLHDESGGKKMEVSLLLVHAQDHLMNALTVKELANEFIDLYKKVNQIGGVRT